MKARARLLALLMAGVVTFGGCGGSSANQTTDENAQASTETKDQAEVTVDGGSTEVSQNEAESNTEESQNRSTLKCSNTRFLRHGNTQEEIIRL